MKDLSWRLNKFENLHCYRKRTAVFSPSLVPFLVSSCLLLSHWLSYFQALLGITQEPFVKAIKDDRGVGV